MKNLLSYILRPLFGLTSRQVKLIVLANKLTSGYNNLATFNNTLIGMKTEWRN